MAPDRGVVLRWPHEPRRLARNAHADASRSGIDTGPGRGSSLRARSRLPSTKRRLIRYTVEPLALELCWPRAGYRLPRIDR
jgi:hypothetical protein